MEKSFFVVVIILFVTVSVCFICCFCCSKKQTVAHNNEVSFDKGIYQNKDWDELKFSVDDDCVPDKETAISIAESIMAHYHQKGHFEDFVTQSVFYDTEDEIWIVTFYEPTINQTGSAFNIAIRKNNAEIIKMWVCG